VPGSADLTAAAGPGRRAVIAADVGGTMIKTMVVAADGRVIKRASVPTAARGGGAAVLAQLEDVGARLVRDARAVGAGRPAAFGLAVPGIVDEAAGVARFAANIGWRDVPLAGRLGRRLGLPVALCHDVRAAARAEARFGSAAGAGDFLLVQAGTGIAAALVLDGRPYPGAHALSGEIGHVAVAGGRRCGCGGTGCLETVASAAAVTRRYRELSGRRVTGAASVARLVTAGDPAARQAWDEAAGALAGALAWCQSVLDPGLVVIGGGLSRAGPVLLEPLARELAGLLTVQRMPRLDASALGDGAGCAGAALAARSAAGLPPWPGPGPGTWPG
jgi:glucokinase